MLVPVIIFVAIPFLGIVIFGAPFVRTLKGQRQQIAKAFELEKGSVVVDFGAGDGSVVIEMARQGFTAVGYELNPFLWSIGWLRCLPFKNASMVLANYWTKPVPAGTAGVFIFSASRFMGRLQKKLTRECPNGVQLVSFAFELPDRKPDKTYEGLHLYKL